MRHISLYGFDRLGCAARPFLHAGFQSDQVVKAEVGAACGRQREGVGGRQAGPAGWEKPQPTGLVPIIDTVLSPLPTAGRQFQRLLKERMKGMGYGKTLGRIVPLKCSCLCLPWNRRRNTGSRCGPPSNEPGSRWPSNGTA